MLRVRGAAGMLPFGAEKIFPHFELRKCLRQRMIQIWNEMFRWMMVYRGLTSLMRR